MMTDATSETFAIAQHKNSDTLLSLVASAKARKPANLVAHWRVSSDSKLYCEWVTE